MYTLNSDRILTILKFNSGSLLFCFKKLDGGGPILHQGLFKIDLLNIRIKVKQNLTLDWSLNSIRKISSISSSTKLFELLK